MKNATIPVTKDEIIDLLGKADETRHAILDLALIADTEGDENGVLFSISTYLKAYEELVKKVRKIKDSTERKEAVVELARML